MTGATWAYQDGAFLPANEARVAADDAGLLHGNGLFETFRARQGRVYLLEHHVERLRAGARELAIDVPEDVDKLPEIVKELAGRCGLADARVRLTLTAGPTGGRPTLLLHARPATDYPPEMYTRGVTAAIASTRRNETSPLARIKSLSYLDNLLAKREALQAGADEALLLNTKGSLAESTTANLFVVRTREVVTPPVADGALPGVTRSAVLELAHAARIAASEATLTVDDLRHADEAFLTNAVAGLLPLVSVDGRNVGSGEPGELTGRLRALYEAAAAAL